MDSSVTTDLVERLKGKATRVGTRGVRMLVEGTVAAVRVVDEFQALLAKQRQQGTKREPVRGVGPERLWMQEPTLARPTPARPVRTRKTLATATAPKRVTAKSGFKAKRGQKHRH